MVIPADRSGLLTTSETKKAIALIRNSVYMPKTISFLEKQSKIRYNIYAVVCEQKIHIKG